MSSAVTTHVLDAALGRPAAGVPVRLESADGVVASGVTDSDGRLRTLGPSSLAPGVYRLVFDIAAYHGPEAFYPTITVEFRFAEGHYHVPILLSPFAYSTYRGS
ncbi:5-hydroxyisourate hydrolase [Kibdelosporangium aridum]|uniref:5-hydroxyisourate hydrolase n=1 Tax=Kibdelosporangium aridum TaxID=2030 RepID=A0A1W2FHE5_KIBAR|nr:5-hydroxyisourate hydrolase [Kibdelosporangium aridum]